MLKRKKFLEANSKLSKSKSISEIIKTENESLNHYEMWTKIKSEFFNTLYSRILYDEKYSFLGDNYIDIYERIKVLSKNIFDDIELQEKFFKMIKEKRFVPSTTIFQSNDKNDKMSSCYILGVEDTLESIDDLISKVMRMSQTGSGISIDFSNLRCTSESVMGKEGASSGVIPVIKIIEQISLFINKMDIRKSASVAWLDIFHGDIQCFIGSKKINANASSRTQTISLGVKIPDIFMSLLKENKEACLFKPKKALDKYGVLLSSIDWNKWYEILSNDDEVVFDRINARKLLKSINSIQFESGYPFIFFSDNVNNADANKKLGRITHTNLCTEMMGRVGREKINNCSVGSINANVFNLGREIVEETFYIATKALSEANKKELLHNNDNSIILSIINVCSFVINKKIKYTDKQANVIFDLMFSTFNYYSLKASMKLAKENNFKYEGFYESIYNQDEYYIKYIEQHIPDHNNYIGDSYPTKDMWEKLKRDIKNHGLYNAYRIGIPPNQSTSYLFSLTPSIFPTAKLVEKRIFNNINLNYFCKEINSENYKYFESLEEVGNKRINELTSIAMKHIDQSIALTPVFNSDHSTRDIALNIIDAWKLGIKTMYYCRISNNKVNYKNK